MEGVAVVQIEVCPPHSLRLAGPQTVAIHQPEEYLVAQTVAPALAGCGDHRVDLLGPEVISFNMRKFGAGGAVAHSLKPLLIRGSDDPNAIDMRNSGHLSA